MKTASTSSNGKPGFLDFFAGCGLVSEAVKRFFTPVWANDISKKKADVFFANHSKKLYRVGPIEEIDGGDLPTACLSWGSFPCQDLSLAGNMEGIASARSGLVWHWLRVMDEMEKKPPIAVAENVVGLVSAANGEHYRKLHAGLTARGYKVGAMVLDASLWVPQSRKRVFVVAIDKAIRTREFESKNPVWCHPASVIRAAQGLDNWVWWSLPEPKPTRQRLEDVIDFQAQWDDGLRTRKLLQLIPPNHRERMEKAIKDGRKVFPGYKRIRHGRQVLELRFDGLAGCLRTPEGGSSRQFLVVWQDDCFRTRLLTVRETAALMGVRKSYRIPGSYNDGYKAMGDAVAVPVARYLARHLLFPLAELAMREIADPSLRIDAS